MRPYRVALKSSLQMHRGITIHRLSTGPPSRLSLGATLGYPQVIHSRGVPGGEDPAGESKRDPTGDSWGITYLR